MNDLKPLDGHCVSFTGRGLSFNRTEAQRLVERLGGRYRRAVSEQTSLLVIGAAGWPLQKNGRLTKKLDEANRLRRRGQALEIESEEDFLRRIGQDVAAIERMYTLPQLSRLLKLSGQQLTAWRRVGLIRPQQRVAGIAYYDFKQIVRCRTLAELAKSRAGSKRLGRALRQLRLIGFESRSLLDRLQLYGSELVVRDEQGRLHQPDGQRLFDFDDAETPRLLSAIQPTDDDFERAVEWELAGELQQAEAAYRQILSRDPEDSDVAYNLANVLAEQQRFSEATRYYRQAIFYDPGFAEAWNNLGNALAECHQYEPSLVAYRQALQIDPHYASPLYGLARALEECGRPDEAQSYWQAYLELAPEGECAEYASRRIARK